MVPNHGRRAAACRLRALRRFRKPLLSELAWAASRPSFPRPTPHLGHATHAPGFNKRVPVADTSVTAAIQRTVRADRGFETRNSDAHVNEYPPTESPAPYYLPPSTAERCLMKLVHKL